MPAFLLPRRSLLAWIMGAWELNGRDGVHEELACRMGWYLADGLSWERRERDVDLTLQSWTGRWKVKGKY